MKNIKKILFRTVTIIFFGFYLLCMIFGIYYSIRITRLQKVYQEELDYCQVLQEIANNFLGENRISVIPDIEVGSRPTILFQVNNDTEDMDSLKNIIKYIYKPFLIGYYRYAIDYRNSRRYYRNYYERDNKIILQEQQLDYIYKFDEYFIYIRFILYMLKNGKCPENINELSNFSFYEENSKRIRTINVTNYVYFNNNININNMTRNRLLLAICISGNDGKAIFTDGTIIRSLNAYLGIHHPKETRIP